MTDPNAVNLQALTPTPITGAEAIQSMIAELQQKLQTAAPGYESLLQRIHVELHKSEDNVHLLKPEQVGVILSALAKRKNIVIAAVESKSSRGKTATGKSLKDVDLADI